MCLRVPVNPSVCLPVRLRATSVGSPGMPLRKILRGFLPVICRRIEMRRGKVGKFREVLRETDFLLSFKIQIYSARREADAKPVTTRSGFWFLFFPAFLLFFILFFFYNLISKCCDTCLRWFGSFLSVSVFRFFFFLCFFSLVQLGNFMLSTTDSNRKAKILTP